MIQAASVGIGIVGKEGRQASLAADFSLLQFKYVQELLLVSLILKQELLPNTKLTLSKWPNLVTLLVTYLAIVIGRSCPSQ